MWIICLTWTWAILYLQITILPSISFSGRGSTNDVGVKTYVPCIFVPQAHTHTWKYFNYRSLKKMQFNFFPQEEVQQWKVALLGRHYYFKTDKCFWWVYTITISEGRRLSISVGKYVTVFQAEIYVILACVYELQNKARSEKYISICSDSQAALKALQAVKTTSPLVRQCQRALDDISTYHSMGLFWVPGHSGIRGNEIADELAKEGSAHHFVGPEPALGVSRQWIRRKIQCWLDRQHLVRWRGLVGTMRQAQELISGPNIAARTALMSFNRAQSRVVTGLLTGHNTLRRHLHTMGCQIVPYAGNVELERKQPMYCVSVKPWQHSDIFIWDPFSWTLRMREVWV
jgi:ribonuclease HI